MKSSYVGITGFMSAKEVNEIFGSIPSHLKRLIMVGVLASFKTLRGIPNKRPNRYPAMDKIASIFPARLRALNLIHYSTDDQSTLAAQLLSVVRFGGSHLDGLQLNVAWPLVSELRDFRRAWPDLQLVLQIGGRALGAIAHSPERLAEKIVWKYAGLIDRILIDPSGGRGKLIEPNKAYEYLYALRQKFSDINLGIAGGLSPTTLKLIKPLAKEFPGLSIDAEGRLRDENDHLDLGLAKEYLLEAAKIFSPSL